MTKIEAAEKLKAILEEATEDENAVCYVTSCDADALDMAIKALKQTEPERKPGKWIWKNEEIIHGNIICHALRCRCSECNFVIDRYEARFINYCPNCGAPMEVDG